MSEEELETVEEMEKSGGHFVSALAACFLRADQNNFPKLRAAFPEYWEEYSKRAHPPRVD